jgi:TIR domain
MTVTNGAVRCFLSHKCNDESHALAQQLKTALNAVGLELLFDPFETGHEIRIRIQTVTFQSFIFLFEPDSWASSMCQEELQVSRERFVPVLTIRLRGAVPDDLKTRLYLDVSRLSGPALADALTELATTVNSRGTLYNTIEALNPRNHPNDTLIAAQSLSDDTDPTLIAESLQRIASFYRPETSPSTRFWLALTIGKAGTREASDVLEQFTWEDHAYPQEGIRQAKKLLRVRE